LISTLVVELASAIQLLPQLLENQMLQFPVKQLKLNLTVLDIMYSMHDHRLDGDIIGYDFHLDMGGQNHKHLLQSLDNC